MALLQYVNQEDRIAWEQFRVVNEFQTTFLQNVGAIQITQDMIDVILALRQWRGFRYTDSNDNDAIGYGIGDPFVEQGMTEDEAYAELIGYIRQKEKTLRAQLPVISIQGTVFNALLSLFIDTGTWRRVKSGNNNYDILYAVQNNNPLLLADMLATGTINPNLRKLEAEVVRLGSYTIRSSRNQKMVEGLGYIRKQYTTNAITSAQQRRQAEFAYFRQTATFGREGVFLPGMSQIRQRMILNNAKS